MGVKSFGDSKKRDPGQLKQRNRSRGGTSLGKGGLQYISLRVIASMWAKVADTGEGLKNANRKAASNRQSCIVKRCSFGGEGGKLSN